MKIYIAIIGSDENVILDKEVPVLNGEADVFLSKLIWEAKKEIEKRDVENSIDS